MDATRLGSNPDLEIDKAYQHVCQVFEESKKLFHTQGPFIHGKDLELNGGAERHVLQLANVASLTSSVFTANNIEFHDLDKYFIEVLKPDAQPISSKLGQLYINLKTQIYLAIMSQENPDTAKDDILGDLFPNNFHVSLSDQNDVIMTEDRTELVRTAYERHNLLLTSSADAETIRAIPSS